MKNRISLILAIILIMSLSFCSDDNNPVEAPDETESNEAAVVTVNSYEDGLLSTTSGVSLQVIAGTVPQNNEGSSADISFSIETPFDAPTGLGSGGEFVGSLVKFGPEGFNFRWPVEMVIPYPENEVPENLYVVHYDEFLENWTMIPKSGIDVVSRLVKFDAINLGIYGLAKFPILDKVAETRPDADGGFMFTGSSQYYYTLTVASVTNYKYPYQAAWSHNSSVGLSASSGYGASNSSSRAVVHFILLQATYQIWISRTTPGTLSRLPIIETYSIPASGKLDGPLLFNQSGYEIGWMTGGGWTTLSLPGGGSWVEGTPNNWAVPTTTYGNGKFQATLRWVNNSSHHTDLDLHLYGPNSLHVFYDDSLSSNGSFKLDRDWLYKEGSAIENIFSLGTIPSGEYTIKVQLYDGDPVDFNVRVILDGVQKKSYNGKLNTVDEEVTIYSFIK